MYDYRHIDTQSKIHSAMHFRGYLIIHIVLPDDF